MGQVAASLGTRGATSSRARKDREAENQLSLFPEPPLSKEELEGYFSRILRALSADDTLPGWPDVFGDSLRTVALRSIPAPIRTVSLFSGGGGLDIGFHDAGFQAGPMVEFEPQFVETLRVNVGTEKRLGTAEPILADIRQWSPPKGLRADFVIGGPPCQTFSAAGRRAAGVPGLDDPRGTLFEEYVRVLRELRPRGFLFENVYGIVGAQGGSAWRAITKAFESIGYRISARILDAADYGAPQHRERLIIVGTPEGGFLFPRPTHGPDSAGERLYYSAGLAVRGVPDEKPGPIRGRFGHLLKDIPPGLNYSFYTEEMGHPAPVFSWRSKFSDLLYKADPAAPVRTIKAQGGQYTGPFHWENRPFSLDELKRLQTFPESYALNGRRQVAIHQIGNSVPSQFARVLAIAVLDQVFHADLPFKLDYLRPDEALGFRQRKRQLTALYKQRAQEAIARLYGGRRPAGRARAAARIGAATPRRAGPRQGMAWLGPLFQWEIRRRRAPSRDWNVAFDVVERDGVLRVAVSEPGEKSAAPAVVMEVKPVRAWPLRATLAVLEASRATPTLYTAAWKAFEDHLARSWLKADLVQLNGYYQYEPRISVRLETLRPRGAEREAPLWTAVRQILEGKGVRTLLSLPALAGLWGLSAAETREALLALRSIGYEVRSEHTNGQIPSGQVLVPYAFPTLTPVSVQLRKQLFPEVGDGACASET